MRIQVLSILLAAVAIAPVAAQNGRLSVEVSVGRSTNSALYEHEVADAAIGSTMETRLSVDDARTISGRLGYRVGGGWMLISELVQGSTGFRYSEFATSRTFGSQFTNEQWGTASRTAVSVGIAHRSVLAAFPLFVEPELSIGTQRLRVGRPSIDCVPQPPSLGVVPCVPNERWERTYSVPGVGAGLSLGYAIVPRVAVQMRGQYSVGRTSTEEAFYVDLIPQYDYAEAPKSRTIRSSHLSLGFRVTP